MRLYSRDDVWGAAKLQRMVVQAVAEGFRPLRPQGRGGQVPAAEPEVEVPPLVPWEVPSDPPFAHPAFRRPPRTSAPPRSDASEPRGAELRPQLPTVSLSQTLPGGTESTPRSRSPSQALPEDHSDSEAASSDSASDPAESSPPSDDEQRGAADPADIPADQGYIIHMLQGTVHAAMTVTEEVPERARMWANGAWHSTRCKLNFRARANYRFADRPALALDLCRRSACAHALGR